MADLKEQRLFLGNLATDTTENDLKDLFNGFKISNIVLKRKSRVDGEVVFAYVNINKKQMDQCLKQLNGCKWKSRVLNIEIAKENFLDRLKKEISQRSQINKNNEKTTSTSFNFRIPALKNKKILFNLMDEESYTDVREVFDAERSSSSSIEDDKNIPCKRNLPMFQGINMKYGDEKYEIDREASFQETVPTTQHIQKFDTDTSMKRFEDFSSVWRDDTNADSFQFSNTDHIRELDGYEEKCSTERKNSKLRTESKETEKEEKYGLNKNSQYVSEMKRRAALEKKWNSIKEKKSLIRNALKNVTSKDSETQRSRSNITLFGDDSSEDGTFEPNFEMKSYLDGDEGLKRLNLKAKFANDERFQIDGRFFDADENETKNIDNLKKEQSIFGSIRRYDPTQSVLSATQSISVQSEPKMKKMRAKLTKLKVEQSEQMQISKPEVSKEKYYSVSDNLKEVFRKSNTETSFSLSAMFDMQLEQNKRSNGEQEKSNLVIHPKKFNFTENFLESNIVPDCEDVEEENEAPLEVLSSAVPSEKLLGKNRTWGETFFFKPDDSRLKEVASFYFSSKPEENEDFGKRRKQLRSIVKKKIQNSRRNERIFKRKLGGKLNRTKFKMRLKKMNFNHY